MGYILLRDCTHQIAGYKHKKYEFPRWAVLELKWTKFPDPEGPILITSKSSIMATASPLIKFDVCIYKKQDQSEEDFFNWATKEYPLKAAPLIKKHGIVKWTQVRSHFPIHGCLKTSLSTMPTPCEQKQTGEMCSVILTQDNDRFRLYNQHSSESLCATR